MSDTMTMADDVNKVKTMLQGKDLSQLNLAEIQAIIKKDWGSKVYFGAKPYLDALGMIEGGMYGADPWQSIVSYFLSNATTWRGDVAKVVKAELKKRLKQNKTARLRDIASNLKSAAAKKAYKIIVIDSANKKVYESTSNGLPDLQKAVGGYIEIAHEIEVKGNLVDTVYVNDEGLFGAQHFFEFKGAHQPFAGNGVVTGTDLESGETVGVHSSLSDVKSKVKFLTIDEVRTKYAKIAEPSFFEWLKNNSPIAYDQDKKKQFKSMGTKFLKKVLSHLSLKESKISYNPGGIAVSGDHSLMGMFDDSKGFHLFFNADGFSRYLTYRTIKNMKDYSGGTNQNIDLSYLDDPAAVALKILDLCEN
jgi:hypothetical protein